VGQVNGFGRRCGRAARARFRGGGSRPFAEAAGFVAESGRGSYLYGPGGARYLDTAAGFGVASLGHSHPHWVEAVVEQARTLAVAPLENDRLDRYLTALGAVLPPSVDRPVLFSGGAEAVETAVRLAQTYSGRAGVLTFAGGFHGKTAALRYTRDPTSAEARRLGPPWLRTADFPACERHDAVDYARCDEDAAAAVAAIADREDLDDVGSVLVEPIQGTAGNIVPLRAFPAALRAVCDDRGWLLVVDESITGFGRTGRLFACDYFGVQPDVMVLSKGLGSGFPLSAVCASTDLWRGSPVGGPSGTTTAFGGNPLACAAGLATLEIVTGLGFLERVTEVAEHAATRLRALADASPLVANPRGVGLMVGLDIVDAETGRLASEHRCRRVMRECRERGVLVAAHVPRVRINPPLTVSRAEIDHLFDVLHEVLE
jgi:4-aminobutyrate aminotransferase-like enzyme